MSQKLWNMNFILICFANLAVSIPFHSLLAVLPIYIESLGGSKEMVGLSLGYLTIAAVTIRPLTGWAIDKFGRKGILLLGLLLFALATSGYVAMVPIYILLILRSLQGLGWGICSTTIGTVASDVIPKTRLGEGLGFFGATASISLALSPALSLSLVDLFPFQNLFLICTVFAFASILLAIVIKSTPTEKPHTNSKMVLFESTALKPSMIMLLVTLTYSSLLSFLALYMRQQGLSSTGLFFTAMALTTLAFRPLAGRLIDTHGQWGCKMIVLTGLAAIASAMVLIVQVSTSTQLIFSGLLYGVGFGFIQPSMLTLCLQGVPASRRGAANATYWTAFDIGVAAGSIVWGIIAQHWGYQLMFQLNILPIFVAAAVYLYDHQQSTTCRSAADSNL